MDRVASCIIQLMQVIAKAFQGLWLRGLCEPAFTLILSICDLLFLSVICFLFDQVLIFSEKNIFGLPAWKSVYLNFMRLL